MGQWWEKSTVYQVYPISFKDSNNDGKGDIKGIIEKLDYLKNLGIEVIWITPIYKSPMIDNGYDIANYYEINDMFGNLYDFKELLNEAKKRNIKIVMDLVMSHCSDKHEWFQKAIEDKNSEYRDYFYFEKEKVSDQRGFFAQEAWTYNEKAGEYYFHLFAKEQPDLNWGNEKVRKAMYEMINYWIDLGVSGFRLDVIDLIGKVPKEFRIDFEKTHEYIKEMHKECFENKDLITVGETAFATEKEAKRYSSEKEKELSMVFSFDHVKVDNDAENGAKWDYTKPDMVKLREIFERWQKELIKEGWNSLYWNNHDQPRIVSRFGNDKKYRNESAKMLAILLHGMKGTPYVYQGEEIGMSNISLKRNEFKDIEAINAIEIRTKMGESEESIIEKVNHMGRDNSRTPMQWDNTEFAAFSSKDPWIKVNPNKETVNVKNALEDKNSIFYTYKNLINLRKKLDIFVEGDFEIMFREKSDVFAYKRKSEKEELVVICNFYDKETQVDFETENFEILEHNYKDIKNENGNLKLRPYEAFLLFKG